MNTAAKLTIPLACAMMLTACGSYYMVKDPVSKVEYYTTELNKRDGATTFEDAKTHKEVTLQNVEIMKVTKDEFKAAVGK